MNVLLLHAGIADRRMWAPQVHGRHETIAGAGHLPGLERPDELNRLLLDFLQ